METEERMETTEESIDGARDCTEGIQFLTVSKYTFSTVSH